MPVDIGRRRSNTTAVYRTNSGALSRITEIGRAIRGVEKINRIDDVASVEVHSLGYVCCDERALEVVRSA